MTHCKQCGTELPDDAKFCLQCGAPVQPEEPTPAPPPAPQAELDFIRPAIMGGMFLGLLSSVPIVNAGNCLCFMWVLAGGAIAAVTVTRQRPAGITYGDGAFAGVLSGLFGAIVGTALQISFRAIETRFLASPQQQLEEMLNRLGAEPPIRDWIVRVFSGEVSTFTVLFTFFTDLIMYSLFAMIGGILAVAILNKRRKATKGT